MSGTPLLQRPASGRQASKMSPEMTRTSVKKLTDEFHSSLKEKSRLHIPARAINADIFVKSVSGSKPSSKADVMARLEENISSLADKHISSSALDGAIASMYKIYIQAAADRAEGVSKDYSANYNLARTDFNNQLNNFLHDAAKFCDGNGDCRQVHLMDILDKKLNEAKLNVFSQVTNSVSNNLAQSRVNYDDVAAPTGEEQEPVKYSRQPVQIMDQVTDVDFTILAEQGNNPLAKKAVVTENGKATLGYADGFLASWWNFTLGHLFGPIHDDKPRAIDEIVAYRVDDIANESTAAVDSDIKADVSEIIKKSAASSMAPEMPVIWLRRYSRDPKYHYYNELK